MKVRCIRTELTEEEFNFSNSKITSIRESAYNSCLLLDEEYEVYGISITPQGTARYLIETSVICESEKTKEGGLILYIPAVLFELTNIAIKNEWVNSTYGECFSFGAKGLIEDENFIEKYLEKEPEAASRFREIKNDILIDLDQSE